MKWTGYCIIIFFWFCRNLIPWDSIENKLFHHFFEHVHHMLLNCTYFGVNIFCSHIDMISLSKQNNEGIRWFMLIWFMGCKNQLTYVAYIHSFYRRMFVDWWLFNFCDVSIFQYIYDVEISFDVKCKHMTKSKHYPAPILMITQINFESC